MEVCEISPIARVSDRENTHQGKNVREIVHTACPSRNQLFEDWSKLAFKFRIGGFQRIGRKVIAVEAIEVPFPRNVLRVGRKWVLATFEIEDVNLPARRKAGEITLRDEMMSARYRH